MREVGIQLEELRRRMQLMDEAAAAGFFQPKDAKRLLKTTVSLCPECLAHVPALVFTRQGQVWLGKSCPAHGHSEALVENDEDFYHLSNKDCWGRRFAADKVIDFPVSGSSPGGCSCVSQNGEEFADQMGNKSCTILVEVTNACNLACPVCYSDARGDRTMTLDLFNQ